MQAMAERMQMLDQYRRIKARHKDAILFFRLGDFYEMFFEDAITASSLLDLTLTKRQGQPMCGIPYHAAKAYIARLLKSGRKVAVCEQLSAPKSKGIVQRDVIEVVTPGTAVDDDFLEHASSNYLVSLCRMKNDICLAFLDASTGEFRAFAKKRDGEQDLEFLKSELYRLAPRELIVQQSLSEEPEVARIIREFDGLLAEKRPDWSFDAQASARRLKERFGLASLKGFGFEDDSPELAAAGILLDYLDENSKTRSPHIQMLHACGGDEFLGLDEATRRNLELVRNLTDSSRRDTLLSILDRTKTAGGSRLMRQWILQPLRGREAIEARLDAVEYFYRDQLLLNETRARLAPILDTERLSARLAMGKAHAKDLVALKDCVRASLAIEKFLASGNAPALLRTGSSPEDRAAAAAFAESVEASIKEDPSILLTEGNIIRAGYDTELDRLRSLKKNATAILERYLEEEKAATGISNLRIRYNRILGYYLEVTKGKLDAVPSHFIRRQSLVTGERFTTERLGELESEIINASENIVELEKNLFLSIRERLQECVNPIQALARGVNVVDCLASFAQAATEGAYSKPAICDENIVDIRQGRHPVVESCLPFGTFIPNDISLDGNDARFALITGPNMAGKSTILRQTALIVLMAHIGSFVPAEEARIGLTDKIFCRVGAQDNLARGESTFLVEMHETAYILNTATVRSLVIMDEVGRGTGTLDGVSIAWAVSGHLLDRTKCRTLFATHYHELTSIEHPHAVNMSMSVLEREGEIVFLKRLVRGAAAGSYGLHVAKIAGLPAEVLAEASKLQSRLANFERSLSLEEISAPDPDPSLEKGDENRAAVPADMESRGDGRKDPGNELFSGEDMAIAKLKSADIDRMTPLEALTLLARIREML